jgi:ADP-ribose pyrophosphatase YjhB (NUDIX family)
LANPEGVTQFPATHAICVMDKCFCSYCGSPTVVRMPEGDHRPRRVCPACGVVHYENPRVVVGCVPEHEGHILICLRAIEPRRGYWTIPAGFMENGETMEDGAARECHEEALATVAIGPLLALVNIPEAHQVHVFFRARLTASAFGAGEESLDAKLVEPEQIPWDDLAFPSTRFALQCYMQERVQETGKPYLTTLPRRLPG